MTGFPWKLVTFDIDGTLTQGHGWRFLAARTGRLPAYDRSNQRFLDHAIGEDEHLRDLLNLAAGLTVPEVERILEATPKIAGIAETVVELHERGARVALLSHNPEYVCRWYQHRFGFDDAAGTPGTSIVDGKIAPYPEVHASKIYGLDRLLAASDADIDSTVHVGDGWADAVIFRRVGGGIALNTALPDVRAAADLSVELTALPAIVEDLEGLVPRNE